jgi:hypothetical protein
MDVSDVLQRILSNIIQHLNVDCDPDIYLFVKVRISQYNDGLRAGRPGFNSQ